jgi:murein DD-endopeptidase MepM/ murein hydrolase activator NlpD
LPDSRRPLRRLGPKRPITRAVAHVAVVGLVAVSAAFGIVATGQTDVGTTQPSRPGLAFNLVEPARAAGGDAQELKSTTFELHPDPNASSDPLISRRVARYEATPPPAPLPTPVAPPPPAPDPKPVAVTRPAPPPVSGNGMLAWPVPGGTISQYYSSYHLAIDIAAPSGSTIVAAAAGVVTSAGWRNNGGGYVIQINHGNGIQTVYNHLSSIWVSVGQSVSRGQGIGGVGCTGNCTGPHCHFEVIVNGVIVNPLRYL